MELYEYEALHTIIAQRIPSSDLAIDTFNVEIEFEYPLPIQQLERLLLLSQKPLEEAQLIVERITGTRLFSWPLPWKCFGTLANLIYDFRCNRDRCVSFNPIYGFRVVQ